MTKPCYWQHCAAAFKEQGQALSSSPVANNSNNAWIVNFNNGNDNNNNKNNNNYVRLVRSSECLPVLVLPSVCFYHQYNVRLPLFQRGIEGDLEILPNPPLAKEGTEISPSPSLQKRGTSSQKTITHKEQGLKPLYQAFTQAKKRKKPSYNRLMFEQDWLSHLFTLLNALQRHTWQPLPSVCFVAKRPKAREIHAPDFADRVVHHWLVPQLEAIYEPVFIYDSFANRKHKGTHAAVSRLQDFVRQVHSGQGGGYYLQLDIHNFFNSIHRPTLYGLLKAKIHPNPPLPKEGASSLKRVQSVSPFVKGGLRGICNQQISPNPSLQKRGTIQCKSTKRLGTQEHLLRTIHALLRQHPKHLASHSRATPQELALVPAHKQLKNAAKGCGLPIGNLSSQFFANVYLNELDQFVKHTLKAKRYVRYVDDFVLVHHNKAQLEAWLEQIEQFLAQRLQLKLKNDIKLQPLTSGIDFLGYWIYPTHKLVRPRVIHHAKQKLSAWQSAYVRRTAQGWLINATQQEQAAIRSVWASYQGHFGHANTVKLEQFFYKRYGWLQQIMPYVAPIPTRKIHPSPPLQNKTKSPLTPLYQRGGQGGASIQSVSPFVKGGLRGIHSPPFYIKAKETP